MLLFFVLGERNLRISESKIKLAFIVFLQKKREKLEKVSLLVPRPAFEIIKVGKMWVKRKMQKNTAI